MYLNISKTNKKTYAHIKKISLNQSKVNSKYYRLQEIPTLLASYGDASPSPQSWAQIATETIR
jgi:hypothetical protein